MFDWVCGVYEGLIWSIFVCIGLFIFGVVGLL